MTQLLTGAYALFARRNVLKISLENLAPMAWTEYSKPWLNVNDIKITKDGTLLKTGSCESQRCNTRDGNGVSCYVTFTSSLHLRRLKKTLRLNKSP